MAADTREDASPKRPESSKPTTAPSKGTAHEPRAVSVAPSPPNTDANLFASLGSLNTAGGRLKEASYSDALRSIKLSDFQEVHTKPCVRDAFLAGIGSGFGIGSVRAILGAPVWKTCNWAVGSFALGSLLMFEYCQRRRVLEKQGIKMAMDVIEMKRQEKKRERAAEEAKAADTKADEGS